MAIINIVNGCFSYQEKRVFNNISIQVEKGEIFCLLGPNGCGKTTLIDCIIGYHSLQAGKIMVEERDSSSFRPGELAQHIAYVPQTHDRTFPYRVIDIVQMGRTAYSGRFSAPSREDRQIARAALEMVGLSHVRHQPYTLLSGGEAQLVMIARALAQQTSVIIMDEPTAHLDFKNEMLVLETIMDLVKNKRLTVIMATHFPNHAFYFENYGISTRVGLMYEQNLLAVGSPSEVLNEENMIKIYNVDTRLVTFQLNEKNMLHQLIPVRSIG